MALMTQIRENLTTLFAVLAVFFIILIVFDWGMDLTGTSGRGAASGDVLGLINGREVSYKEFSERVRREVDGLRQRDPNNEIGEETERQLRSQVWSAIVDETLLEQEIERLGITVTDQEIIDVVKSSNPPEFLTARFRDSSGTFHREDYLQAIAAPENKKAMVEVENIVRQQVKRQKLQSLLLATSQVSENEVRQRFIDRNVTMEAEYVLFDPNRMIQDSVVTLTDEDVRKFYESHPEEFKIRSARRLKYVLFSQMPSKEDSAGVRSEMERFLNQAKSGMDFLELAKTNSEIPVSEAFFKHGELSREKENLVFSARKGQIVGPIQDYDGFHLIKITDERAGKDEFVKASHILLRLISGPDSSKTIQKARDLLRRTRVGEDFAKLARENSEDFGSGVQGGELGWTGKGGWVKEFEQAALRARVGEIVGPVRTQFGWHIIKVTGRDKREVEIVDLAMRVKSSSQTVDVAFQKASDFAYLAKEEGFEKSAEVGGYQVRETPDFTKNSMVPGIGVNDAVSAFAFKNDLGEVSEPMTITGGQAVFKVSSIVEEGVRPFEEVKGISRPLAMKEAKLRKLRDQVDSFHKTLSTGVTFQDAVKGLTNVAAQQTPPFKAPDFPVGIGRDPAFIGMSLNLSAGELSKPFKGLRGYYVMKMISKTTFDSSKFNAERSSLRNDISQEKKNRVVSEWIAGLRAKADIEDHREKFYR